ncbi:MAG: trimethylamine methyltransferase family protein [candidate division KSB1 bacterium]|nr:trimethylamine methyltransferase family protein [candidate division KSB1 bacterium]MDZ7334416.1 trimethylamine methyltransferase family protein [candidate division KSB1 bacterium]MDZ7358670.1 trimethylamine methyltransferase family protein [candidate division KSB1 bacterium]MDZ7398777.1 trimethylamine methyltransferase family protein [candidate division KSB1 bacterium]
MYRPKFAMIEDQQIERILSDAYAVLEKVGVLIENEEAMKLLEANGAKVDRAVRKAYFPAWLIDQSLKSVPNRITIYDRNEQPAMMLEGDQIHFDPGSAALTILDWETQRQRKPVTQDLVNLSRLTHQLQYLAAQSTGLISSDVPQEIADRYRLYIALQHSTKPVVTGTFALDGFDSMKAMLIAIRGSAERLRQMPLAIFDCCPSPPLKWSNLTCQNLIDCAKAGIPAELVSMPLTGATSPGTLGGALVQHAAESLSGVVIHQLAQAGAPIIWGGSPAAFDMRHGTTPMGAIETMMIDAAYAKIGKHLGLPTHAYMALSDAKLLDAQAGLETGMGAVIAALSGINVISGPGMLDFESCQSLEKLVIDNEICGMVLRLVNGIVLRPGMSDDLFGDIYDGEHFLTSQHTIQWLREEFYSPSEVIDRANYQTWLSTDVRSAGERAHQKVQWLLQQPPAPELSEAIAKELGQIMITDARKYGMNRLP